MNSLQKIHVNNKLIFITIHSVTSNYIFITLYNYQNYFSTILPSDKNLRIILLDKYIRYIILQHRTN